ncbi:MAG: ligase-associated DNA damage response endonuclease PdeM [Chitinophagales bacterium]|nr:ligase-associated DNA damage response endonuclease PdeM [Chitinophagales bacterium]
MEILLAGEKLLLLPEKAIFWERKKTLLLSDLHLGKSGHFRKAGIPLPSKIHEEDLDRLTRILEKHKIKTICLLGDLFHSTHNNEWKQFEKWRAEHSSLEIILIKGNHDLYDAEKMKQHGIEKCFSSLEEPPFFFIHDREDENKNQLFSISGHLHPAIRLVGKGRQSAKLPCFWIGKKFCVLPSFGNFTGSATIKPAGSDKVFMIMGDKILELKS